MDKADGASYWNIVAKEMIQVTATMSEDQWIKFKSYQVQKVCSILYGIFT